MRFALFLVLMMIASPLEAFYFSCRKTIQDMLPELYDDEFARMKEFVKHFVASQLRDMPKKQAQRIQDILNKETHFLSDNEAYRSYFTAALVQDATFSEGLKSEMIFFSKFSTHPIIGLNLVHEFAHLKDAVQGNRYVDGLRFWTEENLKKDTVIKREESAARAEYKYLREFYSQEDLEKKRAAFDRKKYFELRKKFLPMRRQLRDNPFAIEKFSKEQLHAYDQWVRMNLDKKLLWNLENAFSMSESEYVTNWSRLYPYRYWNSEHNRRVEATRDFILRATAIVGAMGAAALAYSLYDLDEEELPDQRDQ